MINAQNSVVTTQEAVCTGGWLALMGNVWEAGEKLESSLGGNEGLYHDRCPQHTQREVVACDGQDEQMKELVGWKAGEKVNRQQGVPSGWMRTTQSRLAFLHCVPTCMLPSSVILFAAPTTPTTGSLCI